MKRAIIFFTSGFALLAFNAVAQNDSLFTVNPGETISQAIPSQSQYHSRNFVKGQAWFKDGRTGSVVLNYNWLYDEMMFINEKGDTLAFANPEAFKQFVLNNDTFYFENNLYFQKLGSFGDLQLSQKSYPVIVDVRKIGAMGVETSTVSTDQMKRLPQDNSTTIRNLVLQEKTIIKKVTQYYISNANSLPIPVSKRSLKKITSKDEWDKLQKYFDTYKVNINKKEDLVGLLSTLQ